jgi:hypothetical protein
MEFLNLILSLILFYTISSQIIYEFKRDFELNEGMSEEQIFLKLAYNDLYTFIRIGTPERELKVGITFEEKSLVLLGSNIKNREIFNELASDSYKYISDVFIMPDAFQMTEAVIGEEIINLNNINQRYKIKFLLAKNIENTSLEYNNYEPLYFSGYMGLSISNNYNQQDFPESLPVYLNENYKQNFKSSFTMKFNIKETGNYNGKLIMNEYPHEYDKKNYNIKQYKTIRLQSYDNYDDWCISLDNTYYGNDIIFDSSTIIFRAEYGIILAPSKFMEYLYDIYFKKYMNICDYKGVKLMGASQKFYVCKKELDIKAFKDIKIEVKERNFNFTLSYDNLFYEYNNKYYFLIISGSSSVNNVFTVGSVLMKKYDFVFDKYNSNIGFYDKSIEIKEDPDHTFIIYISIISVLAVLIILVIIYLIWKYMNKPRISRKNELNDEYNYVSGPISDDTK